MDRVGRVQDQSTGLRHKGLVRGITGRPRLASHSDGAGNLDISRAADCALGMRRQVVITTALPGIRRHIGVQRGRDIGSAVASD